LAGRAANLREYLQDLCVETTWASVSKVIVAGAVTRIAIHRPANPHGCWFPDDGRMNQGSLRPSQHDGLEPICFNPRCRPSLRRMKG
jgi:hypothetical protein